MAQRQHCHLADNIEQTPRLLMQAAVLQWLVYMGFVRPLLIPGIRRQTLDFLVPYALFAFAANFARFFACHALCREYCNAPRFFWQLLHKPCIDS